MNVDELRHVVWAAARLLGVHDLVVLGSQAILASFGPAELPPEATRSQEADLAVDANLASGNKATIALDEERMADEIDGVLLENLERPEHRRNAGQVLTRAFA